jgi:hypothetical protein
LFRALAFAPSVLRPFALATFVLTLGTFAPSAGNAEEASSPAATAPDFTREVKPILSDRCFACHGPDAGQRQAELRLDGEIWAKESAIMPGDPDASPLIERISTDDADLRMPPLASHKPAITPEERDILVRWIAAGAPYEEHWAYRPISEPAIPAEFAAQAPHPVDAFLAKIHTERGVAPVGPADPRTLLRRLSFDLRGLPPTAEEVQEFEANPSLAKFEAIVDRYLASPEYAERVAQRWLDLVRYADTNGIHGDNHREHSLYRDWVIQAFEQDLPYDEFTRWQLAGDLLPGATRDQRIASGYNRLNLTTQEGGAQAKEYIAKYQADRVRNVSSVWLGSTMGCCECHDHKYDPFSAKQFYEMAAFFADIEETAVGAQAPTAMPTDEQVAEEQRLREQVAALTQERDAKTPEKLAAYDAWQKQLGEGTSFWRQAGVEAATSEGGAELKAAADGIRATGKNPEKDVYEIRLKSEASAFNLLRMNVDSHADLPAKGPGRAANGNFVLNEVELLVDGKPQPFSAATATHSQGGFDVAGTIDGNRGTGWAVLPKTGENHVVVFTLEEPVPAQAADVRVRLIFDYGGSHTIGAFNLFVADHDGKFDVASLAAMSEVETIARLPEEQRTDEQREKLWRRFVATAESLREANQKLQQVEEMLKNHVGGYPQVVISKSIAPRTVRVLPRGDWLDESGEVVAPAPPEFLTSFEAPQPDVRPTRLDLADWLADEANPLVDRVAANRVWELLFGKGIVETSEDFGSQGTPPLDEELLDWLVQEFRAGDRRIKPLIRKLVLSEAYRRSSTPTPELLEQDPNNHLFARQSRYRLDAEFVRDQALFASGLLVQRVGGPSVKPYQPRGYWAYLNFPQREWENATGADLYRRSMYTYWCRTFLHPAMVAFDAPPREECAARRVRSNTPQQALTLLNDPTYVETSRALAAKAMQSADDESARLDVIVSRTLQRKPTDAEREVLSQLLAKAKARFSAAPASAEEYLKVGQFERPADLDAIELAAWSEVARVVLNLHETLTRY